MRINSYLYTYVSYLYARVCVCVCKYPYQVLNNTFAGNTVYTSCAANKAGYQAHGPFGSVAFVGTDVLHARRCST